LVVRKTGSASLIRHVDYSLIYGGGFEDMQRRVPSIRKIHSLIGWQPRRSLDQMIEDVIADKRTDV
jgi:UDP-glucose 4-epimerase